MKNILLTSLLSSFLTCWGMTALLRAEGHLYFPWVWQSYRPKGEGRPDEVVKGRYKDAVDFALAHPRFFTWGSGGVILRGIRKGRTPKVLASKSLFEDLQRKVDMEGLDYIGSLPDTFIKNVQDPKFHQLYSAYIEAAEDLKTYIHEKAKNST